HGPHVLGAHQPGHLCHRTVGRGSDQVLAAESFERHTPSGCICRAGHSVVPPLSAFRRGLPCSAIMRARRYAIVGGLLGLGAPLGLLALRRLTFSRGRDWLRSELASSWLAYAYLTGATCTVFATFGLTLGRRADLFFESHRQLDRLRDEFVSVIAHD